MSSSYFFPASRVGMAAPPRPLRCRMNIDYATLEQDIESGELAKRLAEELTIGFRLMQEAGDPLPPASYYATKIAEIVHSGAERELSKDLAYYLYQEVLLACEQARTNVAGPVDPPPAG
ncbi:MAG: hypothetical protein ACSLFQ_19870 [Thermoanaerobaculia bacterium]